MYEVLLNNIKNKEVDLTTAEQEKLKTFFHPKKNKKETVLAA